VSSKTINMCAEDLRTLLEEIKVGNMPSVSLPPSKAENQPKKYTFLSRLGLGGSLGLPNAS